MVQHGKEKIHYSNTTFVKVKYDELFYAVIHGDLIQIQHLLKLNIIN